MVASMEETLIHSIKLSSVGPGRMSGQDITHEPSDIDLAMKLHYIRGVYYFRKPAFDGLTIFKIKEPIFTCFNYYYSTCGRFRRSESGRPYIKCNDCGARFIEAKCDLTLDEWLEMKQASIEKLLIPNQVLGPELNFSPPILLQYTGFKCGGVAIGLSWAHILGDAFSAVEFVNLFGTIISGKNPDVPLLPAQSHTVTKSCPSPKELTQEQDPISIKRVDSVGDHWIPANNYKMETFSIHITATQLANLQSQINGNKDSAFESICAVIWKSIAKVRQGSEPRVVTICKKNPNSKTIDEITSNAQLVSVVKADFPVVEANPKDLVALIANDAIDETRKIEETMGRDNGVSDFVVYGANLTFVNLEKATVYELEVRGEKPVCVNYTIDGVGDEGVVVVLLASAGCEKDNVGFGERIVNITLPENQVMGLKSELKREWLIA